MSSVLHATGKQVAGYLGIFRQKQQIKENWNSFFKKISEIKILN